MFDSMLCGFADGLLVGVGVASALVGPLATPGVGRAVGLALAACDASCNRLLATYFENHIFDIHTAAATASMASAISSSIVVSMLTDLS
jgi:hypothetical protein